MTSATEYVNEMLALEIPMLAIRSSRSKLNPWMREGSVWNGMLFCWGTFTDVQQPWSIRVCSPTTMRVWSSQITNLWSAQELLSSHIVNQP